MKLSDLVRAARSGDKHAFGAIVREFQDMAYGGAYAWLGDPEEARDATQDAFLDAWESLGQLREPAAFPGWFRQIVRKHADRHKRRRRPSAELDETQIATSLPDPLQMAEKSELQEVVRSALRRLPESHRLPLTLYYLEERPQRDVAEFLGLPLSTVKKRIHDARHLLGRRITQMAKREMRSTRPSRDDAFARRVDFFIALREGDVGSAARLLDSDSDLLSLKKSYEFSSDEAIPRGLDAASWAAMINDVDMLEMILERGAPLDPPESDSLLHRALLGGAHDTMRLLLDRGADPNKLAGDQTPLHRAAMRNDPAAVDLLMDAGADPDVEDRTGRSATDWAAIKARKGILEHLTSKGAREPRVPLRGPRLRIERRARISAGDVAGAILTARGRSVGDDAGDSAVETSTPLDLVRSDVMETGIKAVDLFAPLQRGGLHAISAGTGVGTAVVVTKIALNLVAELGARVVFAATETVGTRSRIAEWKAADGPDLGRSTTFVLADAGEPSSYRDAAQTALDVADSLREEGHEVLLLMDNRITRANGVHRALRTQRSVTPQSAVTTLCLDSIPPEVDNYDAVIRLDGARSREGLYPAIGPLTSTSTALRTLDSDEAGVVAEAKELLRRYYEHAQPSFKGAAGPGPMSGSLWHTDAASEEEGISARIVTRGRRLDLFLTQPFHGTEMFTGLPGEVVTRQEALDGCRRILEGEFDDVPEEAFLMVGSVDQAVEKATTLQ